MIKVAFTKTKCCCCSVVTLQLYSQMWECDESAMVTWQWFKGWGSIGSMNRCWLIDRCLVLIILLASFLLAELREVRLLPWAPMSFLLPLNSSSCYSKRKLFFFPLKRIGFIHCVSGFMLGFAVFSFTWNKAIKSLNIDRAGLSSQPNVVWTKISPLHPRSTRWKQVCHSNSISSQKSRFWKAHQCWRNLSDCTLLTGTVSLTQFTLKIFKKKENILALHLDMHERFSMCRLKFNDILEMIWIISEINTWPFNSLEIFTFILLWTFAWKH